MRLLLTGDADEVAHFLPDRGGLEPLVPARNLIGEMPPGVLGRGPERGIGGVGEGHLSPMREDRDGVFQEVENGSRRIVLGPGAAGDAHLSADVLEQEGQRPVGVGATRHPVGLPAGKGPGVAVLPSRGGEFEGCKLLAPACEVAGLRHDPRLAQAVQDRMDEGARSGRSRTGR